MVVFGQRWFYSGKGGSIWVKWLYLGKLVVFERRWLYLDKGHNK